MNWMSFVFLHDGHALICRVADSRYWPSADRIIPNLINLTLSVIDKNNGIVGDSCSRVECRLVAIKGLLNEQGPS